MATADEADPVPGGRGADTIDPPPPLPPDTLPSIVRDTSRLRPKKSESDGEKERGKATIDLRGRPVVCNRLFQAFTLLTVRQGNY